MPTSANPLVLSTVKPDFPDLVSQMDTNLLTKSTWTDRITSSMGQTIIEYMSAVGAYSQFSIESGYQEAFPESAKNQSSLYAAANYMGVRTARKIPASVTATITSPETVTIPEYSQFSGASTLWFNRDAIVLAANTPTNITLYQGQVVAAVNNGLGTNFQAFVSPETGCTVSDQDVVFLLNGNAETVTTSGLWTLPGEQGAQDLTLSNGSLILLFGNAQFGSVPQITDTITIIYTVTMGSDGNNIITNGLSVSLTTDSVIAGTFTSQAANGANQPNPYVYKNVTPALWGAFDGSVTPDQYKRLPLSYSGVLDGITFAQRETNPFALSWMNVIKCVLLTSTTWSPTQKQDFIDWFQSKSMYAPRVFLADPVASNVTVTVTIYCKNFSNLTNVQNNATSAINKLFTLGAGSLGKNVYLSDLYDAIMNADSNIDYVEIISPVDDLIISSINVGTPGLTTTTTGGTLGAGSWDYAVSVTLLSGGQSAPANWGTIVTSTGTTNKNVITWDAVENAASYQIWGRQTPTSLGLLGTVVATNPLTFTDDGTISPTGSLPSQGTIPVFYLDLTSLTVTPLYSQRQNPLGG